MIRVGNVNINIRRLGKMETQIKKTLYQELEECRMAWKQVFKECGAYDFVEWLVKKLNGFLEKGLKNLNSKKE